MYIYICKYVFKYVCIHIRSAHVSMCTARAYIPHEHVIPSLPSPRTYWLTSMHKHPWTNTHTHSHAHTHTFTHLHTLTHAHIHTPSKVCVCLFAWHYCVYVYMCTSYFKSQEYVTWCTCTLQHAVTHCNTLQHTVTHCITLQHPAHDSLAYWHDFPPLSLLNNTLQHTATHCNTLQLTATHCNTLHVTCDLFLC